VLAQALLMLTKRVAKKINLNKLTFNFWPHFSQKLTVQPMMKISESIDSSDLHLQTKL